MTWGVVEKDVFWPEGKWIEEEFEVKNTLNFLSF